MPDVQEVFRMATQRVRPDPGALERQNRNQRRRVSRERRGGYALAAALVIAGTVIGITAVRQGDERPGTRPAEPAEQPDIPPPIRGAPPAHGVPKVDYVIDLNTEEMTPLPETIIQTLGEAGEGGWPAWMGEQACMGARCSESRYVVSPDGSLLAYVGTGDEGTPQIFIAGIDGTEVRQMTHDPTGATWPAWSPDGTMIAYAKVGTEGPMGLFVLDVATGESTQVTDETSMSDGLQFTPDGASLLYTGTDIAGLRTVPIAGGRSTLLLGPGDAPGDLGTVGNGSFSPDGALLTFAGPENLSGRDVQRWVANADGTGRRALPGCYDSIPAGAWSPDGSRIVCNEGVPPTYRTIVVIDVATGDAWRVARGSAAIWLDDHTLLVEV
jgi:hypothetical protein